MCMCVYMENLFILIVQLDHWLFLSFSVAVIWYFVFVWGIVCLCCCYCSLCVFIFMCEFHSYLSIQCVQNEFHPLFGCLTLVCTTHARERERKSRGQTPAPYSVRSFTSAPMNSNSLTISGKCPYMCSNKSDKSINQTYAFLFAK